MIPKLEVLYFSGCPNHAPTLRLVREVLGELGLRVEILEVPVETAEEAQSRRFIGSPSIRVEGRDIEPEARGRRDFGLSCRTYGDSGVPPKALLVEALSTASS
jgi:hypothetical protein